jgi:hypothetical protein
VYTYHLTYACYISCVYYPHTTAPINLVESTNIKVLIIYLLHSLIIFKLSGLNALSFAKWHKYVQTLQEKAVQIYVWNCEVTRS